MATGATLVRSPDAARLAELLGSEVRDPRRRTACRRRAARTCRRGRRGERNRPPRAHGRARDARRGLPRAHRRSGRTRDEARRRRVAEVPHDAGGIRLRSRSARPRGDRHCGHRRLGAPGRGWGRATSRERSSRAHSRRRSSCSSSGSSRSRPSGGTGRSRERCWSHPCRTRVLVAKELWIALLAAVLAVVCPGADRRDRGHVARRRRVAGARARFDASSPGGSPRARGDALGNARRRHRCARSRARRSRSSAPSSGS